jgi:hypothetical protein
MIALIIFCFPGVANIKDNVSAAGVDPVKETYDIRIAGIQVTDANKDDILGKGKKEAVYIPETNTLELNGDITADSICFFHSIPGLTIKVTKDIKIKSEDSCAFSFAADTTITGPGRLYVSAPEAGCIILCYELTIKDANLYLSGPAGIEGGATQEEKIIIDNSNIVCDCGERAICYIQKGIELKDAAICDGYSVRYVGGGFPSGYAVCYPSGGKAKKARIIPGYGLIVGDIPVTKANKDDILGKGKKEAVYIPETNTLELNENINLHSDGITNLNQDLTIKVNKDVKIDTTCNYAILIFKETTITGPGKLTLSAPSAEFTIQIITGGLKIIDANIELTSNYMGIASEYNTVSLTIENSYLSASARDTAVGFIAGKIDLRCVKITEPEDGKLSDLSGQVYYIGTANNASARSVKLVPSHNWGKWIVTTQAQVGKKGVETRTCSDCGRKETREIPALTTIKINKKKDSLVCGSSLILKAEAEGTSTDVAWKSSDNKIATVNKNGKVTAKMAGTVTVTASAGGTTATCTVTVLYKDVTDSSDFWYAPTNYLTAKGVVKGYANQTEFRPSNDCTRAQMVTFLYRLQGEPKTKATTCKFDDVKSGDYFYKPVIWAVENGITTGVSAAKFEPQKVCTRAQTVTFLWRMAGKPEPAKNAKKFTDVETKDYFYKATLWASGMKILAGYDDGTFKPQGKCLRRQMVTFLYKYDKYVNGKG